MNPYAPPTARVSDPPLDDRPSVWVTKLLASFFGVLCVLQCSAMLFQRTAVSLVAAAAAALFAVLCGVASLGLWLGRPWSRWVVYVFSTLLCSYYVAGLASDGWPYDRASGSVDALTSALLYVLFSVAAAVYVRWVFRK
jgi:hypothetical protein